ncbi:hypothetical protein DPMN_045889 [Dreissena polymorpha]|uniref:Uncharacterized protein n=1 Tax=Dreissena polymorpha TaxID=45954 RepID=A0A9D4HXR2_DREPO|nr:hypothetical protein DPMN_045889 [Dreissena polymorpha]
MEDRKLRLMDIQMSAAEITDPSLSEAERKTITEKGRGDEMGIMFWDAILGY